jgi:hypothetical protein
MVPTLLSSSPSALLALPLEIRQLIYRFCIPQNFCFTCSYDMYHQNRPIGWYKPTRRLNGTLEENDYPCYEWGYSGVTSTDEGGSDGRDSDEEEEYKPCGLDDYCQLSRRSRPRTSASRPKALPGLLLVCHQITSEVTAMLYRLNTFTVNVHSNGQSELATLFSSETREKMRKMILVLQPTGSSYDPSFRMDRKIWGGVLGKLTVLGVVAEQPHPSPDIWPRETQENVLREWTAWLTPIMEYLGQALPKTCQLVVDANKEEHTTDILEKLMPGRCRFQRLRAGDAIFNRGEFSQESEDWDYDDGPTSCRDIIDSWDYEYYYSD